MAARAASWLKAMVEQPAPRACVQWPFAVNGAGYGQLQYNGELSLAHRVVCEMVHGPAPTKHHEAAHFCGNGHLGCVNWAHIRWATSTENQLDRHRHGTIARGSESHFAVLTEAQAAAIYKDVRTHREIAESYGIGRQTVTNIKTGESWAWLTNHRR